MRHKHNSSSILFHIISALFYVEPISDYNADKPGANTDEVQHRSSPGGVVGLGGPDLGGGYRAFQVACNSA
jgi:hypothetical protein